MEPRFETTVKNEDITEEEYHDYLEEINQLLIQLDAAVNGHLPDDIVQGLNNRIDEVKNYIQEFELMFPKLVVVVERKQPEQQELTLDLNGSQDVPDAARFETTDTPAFTRR